MSTRIRFNAHGLDLLGELDDSPTALALRERLPATFRMSRWGDEYYGRIATDLGVGEAAEARELMEVGELAYWPVGNALCVFFGPTPASDGNEPRAASPVNPMGRLEGALEKLKTLPPEIEAHVTLLEP
ncbi:MAG: cyclophilin-like fold protein [Acidobacteriota bacterium]